MVKPKIGLGDIKNAIDFGKEVLPYVEPTVKKYGPIVAEQISQKAGQAGNAVKGFQGAVFEKAQQIKDNKAHKKELEEARNRAITSSISSVSAEEFFRSFEANISDVNDLKTGYMAISGCYVILTMKSNREKDLSEYKDVYVGCSDTIGFDVYSQLCGFGNVDVYADFKFKQPMKILIYPCDSDQLESRYASLVQDFQSVSSYNKWEAMKSEQSSAQ
jgi:hypothetical protein